MEYLTPDWPAPHAVRAFTTVRQGGVSREPYDSLNLALHVGDDAEHVQENRRRVREQLNVPQEPFWLEQVHGARVIEVAEAPLDRRADACVAHRPGPACAVLTADCLPVLFASTDGRAVGAAHAGWRGLAGGVLEATIAALQVPPRELLVWLGPAIGQEHFEVGPEVREAFMRTNPAAVAAFIASGRVRGHWQADLYRLAKQQLNRAGIDAIYGGDRCTFREQTAFFSYRRDGRTGRMASLIWIE